MSISMISNDRITKLAEKLCENLEKDKKFGVKFILNMVGAGYFAYFDLSPNKIIRSCRPYLQDPEASIIWERFNIPYLKRTLKRLEKQKLVTIETKDGKQVVTIKNKGRVKILKYAIKNLKIDKPDFWNGKWWLVSYDLPIEKSHYRDLIRQYLNKWGFFPIQESLYIHAYPCKNEITFLKEYFGINEFVKVFKVEEIENSDVFKKYFGV